MFAFSQTPILLGCRWIDQARIRDLCELEQLTIDVLSMLHKNCFRILSFKLTLVSLREPTLQMLRKELCPKQIDFRSVAD